MSRARRDAQRRRVKETRRQAGMIHPIFIRRLYSCTARARGVLYRAPQGPPRQHAPRGGEGERLAMHTGHRRHKHNMRQGLWPAPARPLPPASPERGPDFPPHTGQFRPSAAQRGDPGAGSCRPGRLSSRESGSLRGRGKLRLPRANALPGDLLSVSLCHDSAKPQLLLCGRTSAAPPGPQTPGSAQT